MEWWNFVAPIVIILTIAIAADVRSKARKREERARFEGQLAGFCAGLWDNPLFGEYVASRIYKHCRDEIRKYWQLIDKRDIAAANASTDYTYDFAEFALRRAIEHIEQNRRDYGQHEEMLKYLRDREQYVWRVCARKEYWN